MSTRGRFPVLLTLSCANSSPRPSGGSSSILHGPLALALACAASLAALAPARAGGDCPDQRASDVPAHVQESSGEPCFVGIVLFGLPIGMSGPECPAARYFYPAHQECQNLPHPGARCVITGLAPVTFETCTCFFIGTIRLGVGLPLCRCTFRGTAGAIQNASTEDCYPRTI